MQNEQSMVSRLDEENTLLERSRLIFGSMHNNKYLSVGFAVDYKRNQISLFIDIVFF